MVGLSSAWKKNTAYICELLATFVPASLYSSLVPHFDRVNMAVSIVPQEHDMMETWRLLKNFAFLGLQP